MKLPNIKILDESNKILRQKSVDVTFPLDQETKKLIKDSITYLEMSQIPKYSEKYDVVQDDAFLNTKIRIDNDSKNYLLDKISGFHKRSIESYNSEIKRLENDYVLLPVWILNIKYKDKIYHFAMNGQTGKMVGEIPVDTKKLILCILINFIAIFLIVFIVMFVGGFL